MLRYVSILRRSSLAVGFAALIAPATAHSMALPQEEVQLAPQPLDEINQADRLVIETLRESDPQTALQLAKAIQIARNVEFHDDARLYLRKLIALNMDDQQLYNLHEQLGSDFFVSLNVDQNIQPEGREFSRAVLSATKQVSLSPAKVEAWIATLNNPDISVRSAAFRRLQRLGEPATAALLNVFGDKNRVDEFPGIRGALRRMGIAAQGPLLGAAKADNPQVQLEAIRALGYYDSTEAADTLMWAYASPKPARFVRDAALQGLTVQRESQSGVAQSRLDADAIEQRLYDRAVQFLSGKRQTNASLLGVVQDWRWDSSANRMIARELTPETSARVMAATRASELYEINPTSTRNRDLFVMTQLEAAKRKVGPELPMDVAAVIAAAGNDPVEFNRILQDALKLELVPAAVGCCEVLAEIGDPSLLASPNGKPCPLVQAILFGDRHLQFAAFQAITKVDPEQAFPGSSYVLALGVFMAQGGAQSEGLVGHLRPDVAQTYAGSLSSAGLRGIAADSSRQLFEVATSDPDIEVLLVSDNLQNPEYGELIQQLRSDWRTKRIPIALLYRELDYSRRILRRIENDPLFVTIPFSSDPSVVATHVEQLRETCQPWKVNSLDRRRHAAAAVDWLAKVATDRTKYHFYNLGTQESQLTRLLYLPGFAESASQILASLGTPNAQRELVNFASQNGLPVDEREIVVQAFAKSVSKGGTLLTTREIQQQYDRYNASEREAESSQKVLGAILDVIETQKRGSMGQRSKAMLGAEMLRSQDALDAEPAASESGSGD